MRRWAAAAAVAMGTSAFAQTAPNDAADGGTEAASSASASPYVPAGVVLYSPAGVVVYGSAPAGPPGDTSTFSSAGPTVSTGPTVGTGPEVSTGTPIRDAGP